MVTFIVEPFFTKNFNFIYCFKPSFLFGSVPIHCISFCILMPRSLSLLAEYGCGSQREENKCVSCSQVWDFIALVTFPDRSLKGKKSGLRDTVRMLDCFTVLNHRNKHEGLLLMFSLNSNVLLTTFSFLFNFKFIRENFSCFNAKNRKF